MARALVHSGIALAIATTFGCSSPTPESPDAGIPTTGEVGGGDGGDSAAVSLERARKPILDALGAGVKVPADAAVIDATVELDPSGARVTWKVALVPAGEEVLFAPPSSMNQRVGLRPLLQGVQVDGVDVSTRVTDGRWAVPVSAGAFHEIVLRFTLARDGSGVGSGDPRRPAGGALSAIDGALDALEKGGDFGAIVPVVPVVDDPAEAAARYGEVDVLSGGWPVLVGRAVYALSVVAPADLDVDASGRRVGSQRGAAGITHRFVGVGSGDIAIVSSRGLATTTSMLGDVAVTLRLPEKSRRLEKDIGRALEDVATRWGPLSKELAVIAVDGDAVIALPGVILVPARRLHESEPDEQASGGAKGGVTGLAPKLTLSSVLAGALKHHPAEKEALAFAVSTAVAQQWWFGVAAGALDSVLRGGLARRAALDVVAGKGGDKARRRAIELGLRWPLHVALDRGAETAAIADARPGPLVPLKAGLFAEALGRHLSDPLMATLEARLIATPPRDLDGFRDAVLAVAPRPDETRAFLRRWLDETRVAEDLGPIDPEAMLEYLVTDGAVAGLSSQLMNELGPGQLGGRALELLKQGHDLDAGLAVTLLGELAGNEIEDPTLKKWLKVGTQMFGSEGEKKQAIDALVDELAGELGVPETDRSRLRQLSTLLIEQLGKDAAPDAPPSPPSPPAPPPTSP